MSFLFVQITVSFFPMLCLDTLLGGFITHDDLFYAFQGNFIIVIASSSWETTSTSRFCWTDLKFTLHELIPTAFSMKHCIFDRTIYWFKIIWTIGHLSYCLRMYFCIDSQFTFGPIIWACFLFKWVLKVVLCVAEYALHNRQN